MITSNKKSAQQLANTLHSKGVKHIVISPGSRNAPLIIAFTNHDSYQCHSVPDERTAAFIALGMAHETQSPVALVCSSGSALLNYYPAISEAFYREIPLVVLSADRPTYLIDQADGQTIRQENVFANHILYSSSLTELGNTKETWHNQRKINEALNTATGLQNGPVHLNIPFEEPLYQTENIDFCAPQLTSVFHPAATLEAKQINFIVDKIMAAKSPMILIGQMDGCVEINKALEKLSCATLILTETTSNISIANRIQSIDRFLMGLSADEKSNFHPDLLITMGGNVVSKKIKQTLRSSPIDTHIHVGHGYPAPDTYQSLSFVIPQRPSQFLKDLCQEKFLSNNWVKTQLDINHRITKKHQEAVKSIPFSDFQVVNALQSVVDSNHNFHVANSTSIRYAQLFSNWKSPHFYCNRGTSGIDGIVSTAVGHALTSNVTNWLLIGDISFFYDTNALWHAQKPQNLKIVVMNNNGGGIFRFIDGPKSTGQLDTFFETQQPNSIKNIANSFNVNYSHAMSIEGLQNGLQKLKESTDTCILEVHTPRIENADLLKNYFKLLQD